ncbi:hypothetical protein [Paenibacillus sp. E194]|uniref:hypothetical protein n=1 Tax=Paenibacillus sp. E194 TaxID=1458845 RepID=UPI0012E06D32|nr:hypothetical protein [Paenibacillus sp. E194]
MTYGKRRKWRIEVFYNNLSLQNEKAGRISQLILESAYVDSYYLLVIRIAIQAAGLGGSYTLTYDFIIFDWGRRFDSLEAIIENLVRYKLY